MYTIIFVDYFSFSFVIIKSLFIFILDHFDEIIDPSIYNHLHIYSFLFVWFFFLFFWFLLSIIICIQIFYFIFFFFINLLYKTYIIHNIIYIHLLCATYYIFRLFIHSKIHNKHKKKTSHVY